MDLSIDLGTRPPSVENSISQNESGGRLVEDAIDYFTCLEIGKIIEQKAIKAEKLNEETLPDEVIGQFSTLQVPKGNVKFGGEDIVIFNEDDSIEHVKRVNSSTHNDIKLRPILKNIQEYQADVKYVGADIHESSQQEGPFEVFRRCFALCNIPLSQLEDNDQFKTLKKLCEGIRKAFKAKDECYKYVRREEKRRYFKEIGRLKDFIQNLKEHNKSNFSETVLVNKLQEQDEGYKKEINDLTVQITSTTHENSALLSSNAELQTARNKLMEKLESVCLRSRQLENDQKEKIELAKQNMRLNSEYGKFNAEHERLIEKYRSLEQEYATVSRSNHELAAQVDSLTKNVHELTNGYRELKLAHDNFENLNRDLNSKILEESTKVLEIETEAAKLRGDLADLKLTFKSRLQELVDRNIDLKTQVEKRQLESKQMQARYDEVILEQRQIIKQRDKFYRDSDQSFKKTVRLQLQLDQHVKFKEQAIKFNAEKEACLIALKKMDFGCRHLQNSFERVYLQNRELLEFRKAAERTVREMNSKLTKLEQSKKTDAFKIDTLTRQVLKQTDKIDQVHPELTCRKHQQKPHSGKVVGGRDILRSLANTNTLRGNPMVLRKNVC